jgi:uncharacterized protein DUF4160
MRSCAAFSSRSGNGPAFAGMPVIKPIPSNDPAMRRSGNEGTASPASFGPIRRVEVFVGCVGRIGRGQFQQRDQFIEKRDIIRPLLTAFSSLPAANECLGGFRDICLPHSRNRAGIFGAPTTILTSLGLDIFLLPVRKGRFARCSEPGHGDARFGACQFTGLGRGSMPTFLCWGPYRAFFYSNEGGEPPHVHVRSGDREAKF